MNTFFISDTHWGHANVLNFLTNEGTKLRPFTTVDEMDEAMVERWNSVVRPNDKVYHLGDVAMSHRHLHQLGRCNGEKVLIKGNHDTAKLAQYLPYFKDVRGSHQFDGMLLTHIPTHPASLARWGLNVHGHLHSNVVMKMHGDQETKSPDPRYLCVSVEQINYTPISIDEIKKLLV